MFFEWQYDMALTIYRKYLHASSSENLVLLRNLSANSPPSKYSIITAIYVFLMGYELYTFTMFL